MSIGWCVCLQVIRTDISNKESGSVHDTAVCEHDLVDSSSMGECDKWAGQVGACVACVYVFLL